MSVITQCVNHCAAGCFTATTSRIKLPSRQTDATHKGTHLANGNGYKFFEGSHITQTYTVSYHTQDDTHGTIHDHYRTQRPEREGLTSLSALNL